jgi:hypothetical protein
MENLLLESTQNTPLINCDSKGNTITIEGESRPENVRAFYSSLFEWIDNYEKLLFYMTSLSTNEKTVDLNFKLEYFNSSSLKVFMEVIDSLKKISKNVEHVKLNINWFYDEEDEDMLDSGQEFEKMTGAKMNFIMN